MKFWFDMIRKVLKEKINVKPPLKNNFQCITSDTAFSKKYETINSATFCRDPFEIFFDKNVSKVVSWSAPPNLTEIMTGTRREINSQAAKTRPRDREHHFCLLWVVSDSSTFGLTMTKKRGECCAPSILKNY